MNFIVLLGRALFSSVFILKSIEHFTGEVMDYAVSMGVPMAPFLVPISGVIALLGGLSILLGFKARIGAILLIIFLLPTTITMHTFWHASSSFSAMMHEYCFWKNLSLMGASLLIIYFGSGPLSLDRSTKIR